MPIVGHIEGRECITFDLSDVQALELREVCRLRPALVTVPCCGHQAFVRQSVHGLWHFVHRDTTGCEYVGDAPEVMWLKYLAYRVARAAGWEVQLEQRGSGWYSDVVCGSGAWKVALQLFRSGKRLAKRADEQRLLKAAGFRGAWFVKSLPVEFQPTKQLPMFLIEKGWAARDRRPPSVTVGSTVLAFDDALRALLDRRIQFRERCATTGVLRVAVVEVTTLCLPCGYDYLIAPLVAYQEQEAHGGWVGATAPQGELDRTLHAALSIAVAPAAHGEVTVLSGVARVSCPTCGDTMDHWKVVREAREQIADGRRTGVFPAVRAFELPCAPRAWRDPHWCFRDPGGSHCPGPESAAGSELPSAGIEEVQLDEVSYLALLEVLVAERTARSAPWRFRWRGSADPPDSPKEEAPHFRIEPCPAIGLEPVPHPRARVLKLVVPVFGNLADMEQERRADCPSGVRAHLLEKVVANALKASKTVAVEHGCPDEATSLNDERGLKADLTAGIGRFKHPGADPDRELFARHRLALVLDIYSPSPLFRVQDARVPGGVNHACHPASACSCEDEVAPRLRAISAPAGLSTPKISDCPLASTRSKAGTPGIVSN